MAESESVKTFVKDASLAAIASATLDLAVEATSFPVLNDPSPISLAPDTPHQVLMETVLNGAGLILTTLGGLSVFAGHPMIGGFGKQSLAYGLGILAGSSFYEHQLVKILGIRNIRHPVYR